MGVLKQGREIRIPVREIITLPKDADGMFVQPEKLTPKLAVMIEHNRDRMAHKWEYADEWTGNAKTVDPKGDYNCGGCNQASGKVCMAVYDEEKEGTEEKQPPLEIDREYGSCGKYELICAGDPELRASRLPSTVANYGVRKGGSPGHVFGCHECWKAKESKWPDNRGRKLWCGEGASTVEPNACCTLNGAPTIGDK